MLVRELAHYDPDRARVIYDWPVREALLAYSEHLKGIALDGWLAARLEWATLKPTGQNGKLKKPPPMPTILRMEHGRGR